MVGTRSGFDALRREAKRLFKAVRSGDEVALERVTRSLSKASDPPFLREVQQVVAREHGFPSWAALKEHHALEEAIGADRSGWVDVFLEHACIFTPPQDFPAKWRRAERILAREPEIAFATIHTAVVCGEVEHVRTLLERDPRQIHAQGGPQQWEPLLFACYGRLPNARARDRSLEMSVLLLECGADPNTEFVTRDDWKLRFTALAGAMGKGEMGQPEHPHAEALARTLLERGADPNEGQGLYNTHLVGDDTRWLDLLAGHGLGPEDPVRWHADLAGARASGADKCPAMFDYLITGAAKNGHARRLAWLLEHGANPNAVSIYDGLSVYQTALRAGDPGAAQRLLRHGAAAVPLTGHDAFVAAVRNGDRELAERFVREHPEYREIGDPLTEAASRGDVPAARLLLEVGVDPNATSRHGHRALNNACENEEISRLLLVHGADPAARAFGGTACVWACTAQNGAMARFHAERSRSLLDAARSGHLSLAEALLAEDPARIGQCGPVGDSVLHELTEDVSRAEPMIGLLLAHGADPELKNDAGLTPAEQLEARGADGVADLLEVMRGS